MLSIDEQIQQAKEKVAKLERQKKNNSGRSNRLKGKKNNAAITSSAN